MGKKSALSAGTEHLRSAEPWSVPIRNHTGPCCPIAHLSPVLSRSGLSDIGNERTNCHHWALHCGKVLWNGLEWGGKIRDSAEAISASSKSPKTIPTIRPKPWRYFVVPFAMDSPSEVLGLRLPCRRSAPNHTILALCQHKRDKREAHARD